MTPPPAACQPERADLPSPPGAEEVATALKVLRVLGDNPAWIDGGSPALVQVREQAAHLLRACRRQQQRQTRERDEELLSATGIRAGTAAEAPEAPLVPAGTVELASPRTCYVCKRPYTRPHAFYDSLCPGCGDFSHARRVQTADLTGKVALVTGGRIKIGFQVALKLLRAGAAVVVTTRFPRDAARRYAAEADFASWSGRLTLHGLDLRPLPLVDRFGQILAERLPRLDIVINNAAQTVRRPPAFYQHLLEGEREGSPLAPAAAKVLGVQANTLLPPGGSELPWSAALSQLALLPGDAEAGRWLPPGQLDADGQQVDLRQRNSWALRLREVEPLELVETHAVGSLAPFLLLRRLEPLLFRGEGPRHVVNVAAAEGQLNAPWKTPRHPHTNMAKAGLNMITRTCAGAYAEKGVYMNSVDTGWVTNEAPQPRCAEMAGQGFREPLDAVEGAARVLDPVFTGLNTGRHEFGKLWKDYRPVPW